MERDPLSEIDGLKEELFAIKKMLSKTRLPKTTPKTPGDHPDLNTMENNERINDLRDQLLTFTETHDVSGAIAYTGTFRSGNDETTRQSIWASLIPTDYLLTLNEHRMVEKVLSSIGNSQRLTILLALLKKPMTAIQLMQVLGSNTTGQVYHHLKPLISADIISEDKGVYSVIPYRVQGIIMLLAGVWDLTDPRYTSGVWEEQED